MTQCLSPKCLAVNPDHYKFCQRCGKPLWLKDRYQAVKLIGQGGFGRTFLAIDHDKPSKPYCVIKQFCPQLSSTEGLAKAEQLFAEEAKRLDELGHHDQIPSLLAYFTIDGQQYLVQEYIEGENLEQELARTGVFSQVKIEQLLLNLLPVLDFIHRVPVIHRDIKPANIIRRAQDQKLVLVDFGAAKHINPTSKSTTGTIIGTDMYMAPEQGLGRARPASDLYSLGVTCLHLLTGKLPNELFDPEEFEWIWQSHLDDNQVDDSLNQILNKLIISGLSKRYQTAVEISQALTGSTGNKENGESKSRLDAEDYYKMGEIEQEKKNHINAIIYYDKAIEINPDHIDAYNGRLVSRFYLGDYQNAINDCNKIIKITPEVAINYNNRGRIKQELKNYQSAISDYTKAIEINPNCIDAYGNQASAYLSLKDYEAAIRECNKAIEIDPNYIHAYNTRGLSKYCLGDYETAISDFNKVIEIDPNYINVYNSRGSSRYCLGHYETAISDFNKAIEIDPNCVSVYNSRGWLKQELKDYAGAISDFNKAIELNPDFVDAYNGRGLAKHYFLDYRGAVNDFNKAIELDPNYVDAYNNRARSKQMLKDHSGAIDDYTQVIKIDPNCIDAYNN